MKIRLSPCVVGILAAAGLFIVAAEAQPRFGNCYWDGSGPICAGRCRAGFVVRQFARHTATGPCVTGTAVQCCEPMGFISQSQTRESTGAERVKQPKGTGSLKEKTTAAEEVKQRKGAGSLKLPNSTAGEKETKRPIPNR